MNDTTGLIEQEQKVADALVLAWNEYTKLERQHTDDLDIFCEGIHQCQNILAMRIVRRNYPNYWVSNINKAIVNGSEKQFVNNRKEQND